MQRNNRHQDDRPQVPVILLVHRAKPDLVKQNYDNLIIISSEEGSATEFFQKEISKKRVEGIYGFLSENDYLTHEHSVEKVVEYMHNPYVGAVYSDGYISRYNLIPQILPAFSRDTFEQSIINVPLFVSGDILPDWDTELESTYFYDYFKKIGLITILAHIPEPLITSIHNPISANEIQAIHSKYV